MSGHLDHGMASGDARALKITGWLTGVYFLLELGIGIWTGSVAVLSDAFHTFSAVGGVLIALVAGHYASRPASQHATFGLIRAEIVGALINGFFLLGMAVLVFWMGIRRLTDPIHVPAGPMLLAAAGGLITEAASLGVMYRRQKGNLNMKGAFWHVVQTFVGSLIIVVAAAVIYFTGYLRIDPVLGMLFGVVLLWASWGIIRESLRILLDTVPRDLDLGAVVCAVLEQPGVRDVHHVHAWALTTGRNVVSLHALVDEGADFPALQREIWRLLSERYGVYFSTVQLETECLESEEAKAINATAAFDPKTCPPDPAVRGSRRAREQHAHGEHSAH